MRGQESPVCGRHHLAAQVRRAEPCQHTGTTEEHTAITATVLKAAEMSQQMNAGHSAGHHALQWQPVALKLSIQPRKMWRNLKSYS